MLRFKIGSTVVEGMFASVLEVVSAPELPIV
jgi:hypothetical protein